MKKTNPNFSFHAHLDPGHYAPEEILIFGRVAIPDNTYPPKKPAFICHKSFMGWFKIAFLRNRNPVEGRKDVRLPIHLLKREASRHMKTRGGNSTSEERIHKPFLWIQMRFKTNVVNKDFEGLRTISLMYSRKNSVVLSVMALNQRGVFTPHIEHYWKAFNNCEKLYENTFPD